MDEKLPEELGSFNSASSKLSEAVANINEILKQEAESLRKEKEAFDEMSRTLDRVHFGSTVKLNVGGKIYKTALETLRKDPDSMLSSMFSGRFELKPDEEDGAYFIDRDGKMFRYILSYLRNGELVSEIDKNTKRELLAEAKFYQLQGLIAELEPKVICKDSLIIVDEKHNADLNSWLPDDTECSLLYRASTDGKTPRDFHRCCDGKGPTLVVIRNGKNICGGYTSKSWQSVTSIKAKEDSAAFLFTLVNPTETEPMKLSPKSGSKSSIRCQDILGPCFGTETYYDFKVQSTDNATAGTFIIKGGLDLGYGFTCPINVDKKTFFTGKETFAIDEMEVWKVSARK